jgi:hypothetical protein
LFSNFYNIFNYASIALVAIFLVLMFAKLVPESWFIILLLISVGILLLRIILRIYLTFSSKKSKGE